MRPPRFQTAAMAFGLFGAIAHAGETAVSLIAAGMPASCADYAANVSASEGRFNQTSPTINGVTCYGAFQFCSARGSDVGGTFGAYNPGYTPAQFLADPAQQVRAWQAYERDEWAKAQRNGLDAAIGRNVCYAGTCATLTQSSILKACQFGCGSGGKLANFVNSGFDCNAPGTRDGAGTSVCRYLVSGAGYDVSCITNNNDAGECPVVADPPPPNRLVAADPAPVAATAVPAGPSAANAGADAALAGRLSGLIGKSIGAGDPVSLAALVAGLGSTSAWRAGAAVQGNGALTKGAVIATFGEDGAYANVYGQSHAALYLGQDANGVQVLDQWIGHSPAVRTIAWAGNNPAEAAGQFRVVLQ